MIYNSNAFVCARTVATTYNRRRHHPNVVCRLVTTTTLFSSSYTRPPTAACRTVVVAAAVAHACQQLIPVPSTTATPSENVATGAARGYTTTTTDHPPPLFRLLFFFAALFTRRIRGACDRNSVPNTTRAWNRRKIKPIHGQILPLWPDVIRGARSISCSFRSGGVASLLLRTAFGENKNTFIVPVQRPTRTGRETIDRSVPKHGELHIFWRFKRNRE